MGGRSWEPGGDPVLPAGVTKWGVVPALRKGTELEEQVWGQGGEVIDSLIHLVLLSADSSALREAWHMVGALQMCVVGGFMNGDERLWPPGPTLSTTNDFHSSLDNQPLPNTMGEIQARGKQPWQGETQVTLPAGTTHFSAPGRRRS